MPIVLAMALDPGGPLPLNARGVAQIQENPDAMPLRWLAGGAILA
jgi:hypothetical protein